MTRAFGQYIRKRRLALRDGDPKFSLRRVAQAVPIEPSFLSKVERGLAPPPSEEKIVGLAHALVQQVIRKRAPLLAGLIRELGRVPDEAVVRMVREAREEYARQG
jgi:HTH-type transcriptional regulator, competence development regulator